ncbi:retrovirus-related pol polyprotein from transposon TNT 1-94 [Tanacetum coccineum]
MTKRHSKEVETTRKEKVIGNVLDAETRNILTENVRNHRETRTKKPSSEVLGAIAVKKMMKRLKPKRVSWFMHLASEITKDGKVIENSTLWHRRLGHANMHLIQSLASKELVRNLPKLRYDQHFCDACKIGKQARASYKFKNIVSTNRCLEPLHIDLFCPSDVGSYGGNLYTLVIVDDYYRKPTLDYFKVFGSKFFILNTKDYLTKFDPKSYEGVFLCYSQNSKAYIILNKHIMKIEESLNVTFDETPPLSKTSSLVDDDLDEEESIKVLSIVYRNKLDENGIVSRNKAKLVAQGYNQQEGIDYDETYAPVAIEDSIRFIILMLVP